MAAAAALALASCASPAQTSNLQPASEQARVAQRLGPHLIAQVDGVNDEVMERDLAIEKLDIRVNVHGGIAETTLTATFANPLDDDLEGRFSLNMARGAAVTGYALDIEGEMIDGVLETRYNAAAAYQARVNAGIDPGLVEVDYTDRFETRIYPIPAHGSRTIRIKMVSQFMPGEGYVLPLTVDQPIGHVTLEIDGGARIMRAPAGLITARSSEARDVALKGELRLAAFNRPAAVVSRHPGAESFFDIAGSLPRAAIDRHRPLHILWDRSLSRIDDDLEDEAQLAEDLALKRGLRRVMLTLFDSGKAETREVMVDRIAETLADTRYRGATSYAGLSTLAVAPGADCLLFSDGRATLETRKAFHPACAVTAITSGPERDAAWLEDFTRGTGGAMHVLSHDNAEDIFALLDKPNAVILSVTDGKGAAIDVASLVTDRRSFRLVGPAPADGVVLVRVEGEAAPQRFDLASAPKADFSGPGALWARHRIGVIESEAKPSAIAEMARRYSVATPQASFVVLEEPYDYVRVDVEPPATYPARLRAEYAESRAEADAEAREKAAGRMDILLARWAGQKEWWAHSFDGEGSWHPDRPDYDGGRPGPFFAPSAPIAVALPEAEADAAPPAADTPGGGVLNFSGARTTNQAGAVSIGRDVVVHTASRRVDVDSGLPSVGREGSTTVAEWKPDRPYLATLDQAGGDWERVIDAELMSNGQFPVFWFDVAEWLWRKGYKEDARRAVESALDLPTRNNETLAIVAGRLLRYGAHDRAIWLFERLAQLEDRRPQPQRLLALALIARADAVPATANADLGRAIGLLAEVATKKFPREAEGIDLIALMEANAALAKLKGLGGSSDALDPRLVALLDTDLRVVMEWNTPFTDLDLWVLEPREVDVGYENPFSPWGGKLSGDITDGYGPEEYVIRRAIAGEYQVRATTYASDAINPNGPSVLTVRLIRNFGRPEQTEELMDFEMPAEERERQPIGTIRIE